MTNTKETINSANTIYQPGVCVTDYDQAKKFNTYGEVCAIKGEHYLELVAQPKNVYGEPDPETLIWDIDTTSIQTLPQTTLEELKLKSGNNQALQSIEFYLFNFDGHDIIVTKKIDPQGSSGEDIRFETPMLLVAQKSQRTNLV